MSRKFKRLLFISDLHTLSNVGMMSEMLILHKGDEKKENVVYPNAIQKFLLKEWDKMCNDVGMVDVLINVGDSIEGENKSGKGYGVVSTNLEVQGLEAANLIRRIKYKRYCGVDGSKYHIGRGGSSVDGYVAEHLNSTKKPSTFGTDLLLEVYGKNIHVSHKVGATSTIHRATQINKELNMAVINSKAYGDIDFVIRGHAHYYHHVSPFLDGKIRHGLIIPCWKARDEFSRSGSLAWCPVNGYVVIDIYENGEYVIKPHIFQLESDELFQRVKL